MNTKAIVEQIEDSSVVQYQRTFENHSRNTESNASRSTRSQFSEAVSPRVDKSQTDGKILETSNLRVFSFAELKAATRNFRPDLLLGEGEHVRVFKGLVDEKTLAPSIGSPVAIEPRSARFSSVAVSGELPTEAFSSQPCQAIRILIITQESQILAWQNWGQFFVESLVSTKIVGTYAYAAAEYLGTGHVTKKSNVYCFGVVLLEILTGFRALDRHRPMEQQNLVEWAKPLLSDKRKWKTIMDPGIEGQYSLKAALQTAQIILKCLELDPKSRPSMKEVVEALEHVQEGITLAIPPKCQDWIYRYYVQTLNNHLLFSSFFHVEFLNFG